MSDLATLGLPYRITNETAREMAKRRWAKPVEPPAAVPLPVQAVIHAEQTPKPDADDFQTKQLMRVRDHIERLHTMLEGCQEPMDIDRLARALNTLLDRARILSGIAPLKPATVPRSKPSSNLPDPT